MTGPPSPGADASTVLDRVCHLLAELLRLESAASIEAESSLRKDLGVDSLGMVDLVTLLEETFEIRFATNTDLSEIQTVADVTALVEQRIALRMAG